MTVEGLLAQIERNVLVNQTFFILHYFQGQKGKGIVSINKNEERQRKF